MYAFFFFFISHVYFSFNLPLLPIHIALWSVHCRSVQRTNRNAEFLRMERRKTCHGLRVVVVTWNAMSRRMMMICSLPLLTSMIRLIASDVAWTTIGTGIINPEPNILDDRSTDETVCSALLGPSTWMNVEWIFLCFVNLCYKLWPEICQTRTHWCRHGYAQW